MFTQTFLQWTSNRGRRQRGAGEPWPSWIFIHGTNIVDRGLKVLFFVLFLLFFGLFSVVLPWKRLNSAIFLYFLLSFGLFFRYPLPGKFSVNALANNKIKLYDWIVTKQSSSWTFFAVARSSVRFLMRW